MGRKTRTVTNGLSVHLKGIARIIFHLDRMTIFLLFPSRRKRKTANIMSGGLEVTFVWKPVHKFFRKIMYWLPARIYLGIILTVRHNTRHT